MSDLENKYPLLKDKLNKFIRRYYKNQLLRGVLLGGVLLLSYILSISCGEYWAYFSVDIKTFLFVIGVSLLGYVTIFLILIPLFKLFSLRAGLSHRQAAGIISVHFPELEDRLLNTIELAQGLDKGIKSPDLLIASVNQRIDNMRVIPFGQAISFRENLKYLNILIVIIFLGCLGFWIYPNLYSSSSQRLIHFRQNYEAPAPFQFVLGNDSLEVEKGGDFLLKVVIQGEYAPNEVYCCYGGNRFRMKKVRGNIFTHQLRGLNNTLDFYFQAEDYRSKDYKLEVISLPAVINFHLRVIPPRYTGIKSEEVQNQGDLSIAQGSRVKWEFVGQNLDQLILKFYDQDKRVTTQRNGMNFSCEKTLMGSTDYGVWGSSLRFSPRELVKYRVSVIPDQTPTIHVSSLPDTLQPTARYFKGVIKDDYGFSNLYFKYVIGDEPTKQILIPINRSLKGQEFYFAFDFGRIGAKEGEVVAYFFEVFDNDGIHGPKSARSDKNSFYRPSARQLYNMEEQLHDSMTYKLEESRSLSRSLQKDILRMQQNAIENASDQWQKQQLFKQLGQKQQRLESLLKDIRNDFAKKNQFLNSMSKKDSLLLEKQRHIQELLSKVMDKELKKLMDEFNELAKDFDPQKLNKLGDRMKMSMGDLDKQLERNLELLKRYQVEGLYRELTQRVKQLGESQLRNSQNSDDPQEKQKDLQIQDSKNLEDIRDDYKEFNQRNNKLKQSYELEDFDEDIQDIGRSMQQSQEMLNDKKMGNARRNQQRTSQQLKSLAKRMGESLSRSMNAQLVVDVENLMRMLNHLQELSFQQEELIYEVRNIDYRDPRYQEAIHNQMLLQEKYGLVQDSLLVLSSKSPHIAAAMGDRIFTIKQKLEEVTDVFQERRKYRAGVLQQEIMTQVNDLALLLSEALSNLSAQAQQAGAVNGKGNGWSSPSISGMRKQQQSLKQQLEQMISQMKKGGRQSDAIGEKMGRMLKQQEMYRKSLQDMVRRGQMGPKTTRIIQDIMKMLEHTEREIANFSINSNTLTRQNRIMTRLLEAENAQRQRDWDTKRESRRGNDSKLSNPKEIFEYKRIRDNFIDNFYESDVRLHYYYNRVYLDYMIKLNND